ncbi:hypothetical protein F5Y16DRAFT_392754 [Xylariaceae sp. FL0255]|nr:hypothetical protein F5Y16DRAFT_392754 [Xylariaceae sp. FL0255]
MSLSISDHVVQCLQHFQAILAGSGHYPLDEAARQSLLNEFARFKLWSGNIGAHRKGRSSLDGRLRDASHLRDLVNNLLTDLQGSLNDLGEIDFDRDSNDSASSSQLTGPNLEDLTPSASQDVSEMILTERCDGDNTDSEALEITADIGDIIGCLLRLSISIRNPAPHDHFMTSKATDTSYFEEYDVEHVKSKLSHVDSTLACRLGKAISQRRQYFKYRETHRQKLGEGLIPHIPKAPGSEAGVQSTIASSIPLALKDEKSCNPSFSRLDEDEISNSGASQTSYATSGPASGRLKMPSLPEEASQGPFECPFCYMIISVTTTIQWKKHVNADLRPYICLETECSTPEQQYSRRHEWLDHLNQKHWQVFKCPYSCLSENFGSPRELEQHIRQSHKELSLQKDLGMILDLCSRPGSWPEETTCPLCDQKLHSKQEYARHVGRHQTELALFALPHTGNENSDSSHDDDDDNGGDDVLESEDNAEDREHGNENEHLQGMWDNVKDNLEFRISKQALIQRVEELNREANAWLTEFFNDLERLPEDHKSQPNDCPDRKEATDELKDIMSKRPLVTKVLRSSQHSDEEGNTYNSRTITNENFELSEEFFQLRQLATELESQRVRWRSYYTKLHSEVEMPSYSVHETISKFVCSGCKMEDYFEYQRDVSEAVCKHCGAPRPDHQLHEPPRRNDANRSDESLKRDESKIDQGYGEDFEHIPNTIPVIQRGDGFFDEFGNWCPVPDSEEGTEIHRPAVLAQSARNVNAADGQDRPRLKLETRFKTPQNEQGDSLRLSTLTCNHCGLQFTQEQNLWSHLLTHPEILPDPLCDESSDPNLDGEKTSYWSIREASEFPSLLRTFGSDWGAIASHMGTKTPIMVKNYYMRRSDDSWETMVRNADERRSQGLTTPPPPLINTSRSDHNGDSNSQLVATEDQPKDIHIKGERGAIPLADDDLQCSVCGFKPTGKAENRPMYLRKHMRTHKRTEMRLCDQCGKQFTRADNLATHRRKTHGLDLGLERLKRKEPGAD